MRQNYSLAKNLAFQLFSFLANTKATANKSPHKYKGDYSTSMWQCIYKTYLIRLKNACWLNYIDFFKQINKLMIADIQNYITIWSRVTSLSLSFILHLFFCNVSTDFSSDYSDNLFFSIYFFLSFFLLFQILFPYYPFLGQFLLPLFQILSVFQKYF